MCKVSGRGTDVLLVGQAFPAAEDFDGRFGDTHTPSSCSCLDVKAVAIEVDSFQSRG